MFGIDNQVASFKVKTRISKAAQLSAMVFRKKVEKLQLKGCEVEVL